MSSQSTRFSLLSRLIASTLATALALPLLSSPALAENYDEIVVTALGRGSTLQDSPAAITVIGQQQLERKGVERIEGIVALTPGMNIVNSAEVADTQVNIRGLNGARDAEINYALVVDGIVQTNPAALNREWGNLTQVEVLKGPQSALYGRNAAAGAIIMTTKLPEAPLEGDVKLSYAEDASSLATARIGGVSDNSQFKWQLFGNFRQTDGFRRDSFNQTDDTIDDYEEYSVDARLVWEPSDATSVDTKIRYGEVDAGSIVFNSLFHLPGFTGFLGPDANEDINGHDYNFYPNINSSNNQETLELSARVEQDLGWADLIGWGLYSDIDNSLGADGTSGAFGFFFAEQNCIDSTAALEGFPVNSPQFIGPDPASSLFGAYLPVTCDGTQYQERNQKDYSFEVRLRSKDEGRLRWEGGLYYLNIEREVGVNLGVDTGEGLVEQLYTTNPKNPTEQLLRDKFDTDVYAIFGQVDYDIFDTVTAGFALRYDYEDRQVTNQVPISATTQFLVCDFGDPFTGGAPLNQGLCEDPTGDSGDQKESFDQWQPKATLNWGATDSLDMFASIGVGFKSGGFNNFGSQETVDEFINDPFVDGTGFDRVEIANDYDEETSTAIELGFRTSIGDTLQIDGAIYHIDVDDQQFFEFFVGQFGLLRVVSNIDSVEIKGAELSTTWSPFDWLDFQANGSYIDSEIDDNDSRPDTEGNDAPYTPEYTFYFGTDVTWPLNPQLDLIGTLGVTGTGNTWFHSVQDQERPTIFGANGDYSVTERDSFELVDARIGLAGDDWTLVAFGKNILDKNYTEEVIPAPEFGGSFNAPGGESRWGVEFTKSF
jgi:iron complex outermembrane receptor protein